MKAWVFVEGLADRLGLEALWTDWRHRLGASGWGIAIIPLESKSNFLKKFGARAAEKLVAAPGDIVVGMPDLYPTVPFTGTEFQHGDVASLKEIQRRAVHGALARIYGVYGAEAEAAVLRLFPSVFRHDFEMLLLAALDQLRSHLGTTEKLGKWRVPVEDQNLDKPPKRVVEELFLTKSKTRRAYRETKDAQAILRRVTDLRTTFRTKAGKWTCPEFVRVMRWLGEQTDVPVCDLD